VDWINPAWDRVIVEGSCERAGSINGINSLAPLIRFLGLKMNSSS
jgi:hypothetical protein